MGVSPPWPKWAWPPSLLDITREGFTKTSAMLSPFVALLSLETGVAETGVYNDPTPFETLINGIPSWAFDTYTRQGREALRRLLHSQAGMAQWANACLPATGRVKVLGELLFRVEGQCLAGRSTGPLSEKLRYRWERECLGLSPGDTMQGIETMTATIPELNAIRAEVLREGRV